jgi:hypothetical protein
MPHENSPRAQQIAHYLALAARHHERAERATDMALAKSYATLAKGYEQLARDIESFRQFMRAAPSPPVRHADLARH